MVFVIGYLNDIDFVSSFWDLGNKCKMVVVRKILFVK